MDARCGSSKMRPNRSGRFLHDASHSQVSPVLIVILTGLSSPSTMMWTRRTINPNSFRKAREICLIICGTFNAGTLKFSKTFPRRKTPVLPC